jgi:hypothetical protein
MDGLINWLTIGGFVATVVSLGLAIYFYFKSQRNREPCWAIRTRTLVEERSSKFIGLEISYRGVPVETLSVSRALFWNNGAETINSVDITAGNPLRWKAKNGVKILDATLLSANNDANQFAEPAVVNEDEVPILFDYIDRDQGALYQIVHTGTGNWSIALMGTIKGAKQLRHVDPDENIVTMLTGLMGSRASRVARYVLATLFAIVALFSLMGGVFIAWSQSQGLIFDIRTGARVGWEAWPVALVSIGGGLMCAWGAWSVWPKPLVRGLGAFDDALM